MSAANHTERAAAHTDCAELRLELPRGLPLLTRLLPGSDREAIVGDLLEDADSRDLHGAPRAWWLARECGAIAAGLSAQRVRGWVVLPPVREVGAGLAVDGRGLLRGDPLGRALRALVFCGSVATLVLGVEVLVSALLSASGF